MGQYHIEGWSRKLMWTVPTEWKRIHIFDISVEFWNSFTVLRRPWVLLVHNQIQNARFHSISDLINIHVCDIDINLRLLRLTADLSNEPRKVPHIYINGFMSSIFSSSFETHSPSFDVYEFHWFTIRFRMRDFAVYLILWYSCLW